MRWFSKKTVYPIGIEAGAKSLKLSQLSETADGFSLIAAASIPLPGDIVSGSGQWQKWTIDTIKKVTGEIKFTGKNVVAAMLQKEIFISQVKIPKAKEQDLEKAIIAKVKHKFPFAAENAILKYIPSREDNYLVVASEKERINRHLAIFEKANLNITTIGIWPNAMMNCYVNFFGRRRSDIKKIVMLLDINDSCTNVVICQHKNVMFAHSIPIGDQALADKDKTTKLVLELTACKQYFDSMSLESPIEHLVFLCEGSFDAEICRTIAEQLETPAQMGNCLAAVNIDNVENPYFDRRQSSSNWATVFGLSLQNK